MTIFNPAASHKGESGRPKLLGVFQGATDTRVSDGDGVRWAELLK